MFRMGDAVMWKITLILTLVCATSGADADFDAEEISRVITETTKCYENPGVTISVVKNGKVLLSRGFGVQNLEDKKPVTEDTVFGIASVSKSFAATLLVKLILETTNLTIDSKVRDMLGDEFQMPDKFRTEEATFADLMAHRMAIPSHNRIRFDTALTRETLLKRLPLLPVKDQFRVKYTYSNLVYGLVTHLAERLGGASWEDLVTKHLLEPLGMSSTTFATTADLENMDKLATGYTLSGDDFVSISPEFSRQWGSLAGSGAVMSTAKDMAKWMIFHLREGRAPDGKLVVARKHLQEVHKPRFLISTSSSQELRVPQFPVTATQNVYAHGLRRGYYRDYERVAHSGSTIGYKAYMSLLPSQQIGVYVGLTGLDNSYTYRQALTYYLLDKALGVPAWLNATTICSFPEPWKRKSKSSGAPNLSASRKPQLPLSEFEGTYDNKAYNSLDVRFNSSLDTLVLYYGWGEWQLFYRETKGKEHKFYGQAIGITVGLSLNPLYFIQNQHEGKSAITHLKATAFESKLPPMFVKNGNPVAVGETTAEISRSINIESTEVSKTGLASVNPTQHTGEEGVDTASVLEAQVKATTESPNDSLSLKPFMLVIFVSVVFHHIL